MKKIHNLIIAVLLCCLLILPVSANDDLFYYDHTDPEIVQTIEDLETQRKRYDQRYLEEFYLPEGEVYDENKVSYKTEELYCAYWWKPEDIAAFMKAEDKQAFLKTLEINEFRYPMYYDGVLLEEYMECFKYVDGMGRYMNSGAGNRLAKEKVLISNKNLILQSLAQDGLEGYEPIQSLNAEGFLFVIAEKDEELYAIYMPYDSDSNLLDIFQQNYGELLEKRVLNVSDAELFAQRYYEVLEIEKEGGTSTATGSVQNSEIQIETETPVNASWIYWLGGGGVVVIAGVAVLLLVLRRKKHN